MAILPRTELKDVALAQEIINDLTVNAAVYHTHESDVAKEFEYVGHRDQ